jgi:hypothetical protein
MKVVEFQLQIHDTSITASDILQMIDPSAPFPDPLEGGDGKGPLYQCILREEKVKDFLEYCEKDTTIRIYTSLHPFELADDLYQGKFYVHWQFGKDPTVSKSKY